MSRFGRLSLNPGRRLNSRIPLMVSLSNHEPGTRPSTLRQSSGSSRAQSRDDRLKTSGTPGHRDQNEKRVPTSIRRAGAAEVDWPKNGELRTPLKFSALTRFNVLYDWA